MARRSQCSSAGDNPLDPNYLPPHYREEYRLAVDALVEEDLEGYYQFLQKADVVDFLSSPEIQYIQESVRVPQQSSHPEQRFLEPGGDGSSDTYWPLHSDLDAPGLDLGWPQLHHFIGPTEVTTLVNPPEPDMPSIKEQARRLIKNAQQVIAIVMDMFTDVDILHDILNAAMRNVAVYILLDKQNVHHFINMVSNCRVNLQSIQFLRVRIVSGITYHCRSGKSFEGQMMDRFLLTDCRAVLSGNYSFMWSFEKLHRCMAHLFLGQLVSTFDEEFRILFAQSQPLVIDSVPPPMEDYSMLQKRQFPSERLSLYRDPKKLMDTPHQEEWAKHSYDQRMDMDWRMTPLKRQEPLHGPADMHGRFPSHQSRMDPAFDQGPSRMPVMENPAFKRHSYAEGVHGKYSYPFLPQQGMPEPDNLGRQFHRGQQPYPGPGPGKEDYSAYDKFWNQDYLSTDQYPEPALPQEMEAPDDFDPVLNYLSSSRNVDYDQGSEKSPADFPFSSTHPIRSSLGKPYACQTSPTPSNPTEQKQFFLEPNTDRKDPVVKRGLRDWRINSYLSAYDNPEDEGLPMGPPNVADPFEELPNLRQQTAPGIDLSVPKIPNVREFKVPAIPRASQMPSYVKTTTREQPKKLPDEPISVAAETKTTPTPSESSSTTDVEKTEEPEQREPKTSFVHREESFRRKYNVAVPRSSRLRSSLIFSSLDQQNTSEDTKTAPGQPGEEGDKNEAEQTKLPLVSQVLGQRRSTAREPFEWSRYMKSATFDNSGTDSSKPEDGNTKADDKDTSKDEDSKDLSEKCEIKESLKPPDVEQASSSPSVPQSKPSEAESTKTDQPMQPPKSLPTSSLFVDMSDPDTRLMFFKELAAKRKAAKAAEAEKSKEKVPMKPSPDLIRNSAVKKEEAIPPGEAEKLSDATTSEGLSEKNATAKDVEKTVSTPSLSLDVSDETNKDTLVKNDSSPNQNYKKEQTQVSKDSQKMELKKSTTAEVPQLSSPAVEKSSPSHPPTPTCTTPTNILSLTQGTDKNKNTCLDSTSEEHILFTPSSVEVPPSFVMHSDSQSPGSVQFKNSFSSPSALSEKDTGTEFSSSNILDQTSSSDQILTDSGSHIGPGLSTARETISSNLITEDSSSTLTSSTLSPNAQEAVSVIVPKPSQSAGDTTQKPSVASVNQTESESTQTHLHSVFQLTSSETPSAVDSAHVESDISPGTCAAGPEPDTSSLQFTKKTDSEESPAPAEKDRNSAAQQAVGEESEDVKADSALLNVSDAESKCDKNETNFPAPSPTDSLPGHSLAETSSPVSPELTPKASLSETTAFPQDRPIEVIPPSEHSLARSVTPTPAETVSCSSPPIQSVGSVLSPEAENTLSALHNATETNTVSEQTTTASNETPKLSSAETCSPTEPTSKIPTEPDLPCKAPDSVTSETTEPPVSAENTNMDQQAKVNQEPETLEADEKKTEDSEATKKVNETTTEASVCSEKTNDQVRQSNGSELSEVASDEVPPTSPQSKQPKSSQSRYQSSTANVLSSSNLRDDTKLLLEQISANSQSRSEVTKESPVTDDEKEDEADKNAKREKERRIRSAGGQPKSNQEREKLLERIQSMRKERKVYSRFEMAP